MPSDIKKRADSLIKAAVAAPLARHGFRRRGACYVRALGDLLHLVDVQYARITIATKRTFTLNCGIYVAGVTSALGNLPDPEQPGIADCCVRIRVGHLGPPYRDVWWEISDEDGAEKDAHIRVEITDVVEGNVLPFLAQFQTMQALAEMLTNPKTEVEKRATLRSDAYRLIDAAVLWRRMGNREKCSACVAEASRLAVGKPGEELVARFVARFQC